MSNLKFLVVFTVISIALANLFFFYPGVIGAIPYGTFTFGFATLICFWVANRLKAAPAGADDTAKMLISTMRNYFGVMGVFFFFDGIAHVGVPALYPDALVASYVHNFSHIFFFIGNAIIIRIPVYFLNPRWLNAASIVQVIGGVISVGYGLFVPDSLVYVFGPNAAPILIVSATQDLLFLIANGIALLLPGLYVIYLSLRLTDKAGRVRAVLLGSGMIIFFAIGPVINVVHNQYLQLLIHLLQATSFCLMGASAFYGVAKRTESSGTVTAS